MTASTSRGTFFLSLESLRGLAALTVAVHHANWWHPVGDWTFFQNGALMVDLFFVLSGFVICHSYAQQPMDGRSFGRFIWLRLGRLYPLHLAMLLLFIGIEALKWYAETAHGVVADKPAFTINDGEAVVSNLLLMHALGVHDSLTFNFPSWSISAEFYNYLLFGVIVLLCGLRGRLTAVAAGIVAASLVVLFLAGKTSLEHSGYDYGFIRCSAGFFLGVITYQLHRRLVDPQPVPESAAGLGFPAVLSAGIVVAILCLKPRGEPDYLLLLLFAALILTMTTSPCVWLDRALQSRPLLWLGKVSYSVYMTHAAIAWGCKQLLTVVLQQPRVDVGGETGIQIQTDAVLGLAFLAGYLVLVLAASQLTFKWIESPFRRKARRLARRWFEPRAPETTEPLRAA